MNNNCNKCRWNYKSYHCIDCYDFDGKMSDCDKFCYYCNHNIGDDACNNCIYSTY